MKELFYSPDAWVTSLVLAILLVVAWRIGVWLGRRARERGDTSGMGKVGDASLALMGLLLGFTFAMALQKHDQRRLEVVNDSNAIGDFYTAASMLKEPMRSQLCGLIRQYAEHRLKVVKLARNKEMLEQALQDAVKMQGQMTEMVRQALDSGDTVVATPLVNTLNEVTSNHAARLAAYRDVPPGSVVLLLFFVSLIAVALLGRHEGTEPKAHVRSAVSFVIVIVCCIYVTLDLNQPQRGLIRISQEPMERLVQSMRN